MADLTPDERDELIAALLEARPWGDADGAKRIDPRIGGAWPEPMAAVALADLTDDEVREGLREAGLRLGGNAWWGHSGPASLEWWFHGGWQVYSFEGAVLFRGTASSPAMARRTAERVALAHEWSGP
jgi:hypothetical protein